MTNPVPHSSPASNAARNVRLLRLGGLLALAAVVVVAAIMLSGGGTKDTPAPATLSAAAPAAATPDLTGIPQDGNVLGDPNAPVRIVEFADLQCPFCREFALSPTFKSIVDGPVRGGEIRMEFRTLAFIGPDSGTAARLAEAAGRQNKLWQVVEQLYARQGTENSGWLTSGLQSQVLGAVPGLDAARVRADAGSAAVKQQLTASQELATSSKVESTPSFLVGRGDDLTLVGADGLADAVTAAMKR